jgi:hypothetical protein
MQAGTFIHVLVGSLERKEPAHLLGKGAVYSFDAVPPATRHSLPTFSLIRGSFSLCSWLLISVSIFLL